MSVVFVLVIIGVFVAGGFLFAFIWAVKSGQYEDSYSPSVRILFDDYIKEPEKTPSEKEKAKPKKNNKSNNKD